VLNPAQYARGWHTTGTLGTLGASVTAGRLLGLDATQLRTALGIAASSAGGLRQNFGSMVKPLHAGQAAFHGTTAAQLASRGFSADLDILDGPRGFMGVFGGAPEDGFALDIFTAPPNEILQPGLSFKRFACCGAISTALDALLLLVDRHHLTADNIARMRCEVNRGAPDILIHSTASTALQGKFSLQYSLAVALLDGDAGLAQYTDERVNEPRVQELSRRVEVVVNPDFPHEPAFPSTVILETVDGRRFSETVDIPVGRPEHPMSWDDLSRKFRSCAAGVLPAAAAEHALSLARGLSSLANVAELARAAGAFEDHGPTGVAAPRFTEQEPRMPTNRGRWGAEDERGTANLLTADVVLQACQTPRTGRVYNLGIEVKQGAPVAGRRISPVHLMSTDGGDYAALGRQDWGTADDYLLLAAGGTSHIDGLAHMWHRGQLYNGFPFTEVRSSGAARCGIEKTGGLVLRAHLLDFATAPTRTPHVITTADIKAYLAARNVILAPGDGLLFRTGWMEAALEDELDGRQFPAVAPETAAWLAEQDIALVGADNPAVEATAVRGIMPPLHEVLLCELGMYIMEMLYLADPARAGAVTGLLVVAPLLITRGVNSPVNPLFIT
jgi:kynurenine formamidase